MAKKQKLKRSSRGRVTTEQARQEDKIRKQAMADFPPASGKKKKRLPTSGIPARLRRARKEQGLTLYAVAQAAGIPNPNTVRDIELGERDARLSNIEAVAHALGLTLELTESSP